MHDLQNFYINASFLMCPKEFSCCDIRQVICSGIRYGLKFMPENFSKTLDVDEVCDIAYDLFSKYREATLYAKVNDLPVKIILFADDWETGLKIVALEPCLAKKYKNDLYVDTNFYINLALCLSEDFAIIRILLKKPETNMR